MRGETAPVEPARDDPKPQRLEDAEREAVIEASAAERGNLSKVAQRLGISRPTLYRKLAQFGIQAHRSFSELPGEIGERPLASARRTEGRAFRARIEPFRGLRQDFRRLRVEPAAGVGAAAPWRRDRRSRIPGRGFNLFKGLAEDSPGDCRPRAQRNVCSPGPAGRAPFLPLPAAIPTNRPRASGREAAPTALFDHLEQI